MFLAFSYAYFYKVYKFGFKVAARFCRNFELSISMGKMLEATAKALLQDLFRIQWLLCGNENPDH
tara:strand:+ start:21330 stop:21524 length:195 start_codon:yes stop_codon:yes gene_type:complete